MALISVLLVVAVLLAVAANLMMRHSLVISQNQNAYHQNQALQYAFGAEALARQILFEDFSVGGSEVDHLGEIWATPVLPFELDEGGYLEAQIYDLQGCHNLNNILASDEALVQLRRLFTNIGAQPALAEAWKDWVDADDVISGFGAEDSEYLIAEVPHRTPNIPVSHASEMRALQNATREELDLILPEVCALPTAPGEFTKLNINTASAHALAALDDAISAASLTPLTEGVREFTDVNEFVTEYPEFNEVRTQLDVASQYFAVHAIAEVGDSTVTLYSRLRRDSADGKITVLSRDFGRLFRSNVELATN